MSRAWLDSLSEDWVSQPRSDGTQPSLGLSHDASTGDSSGPKIKTSESRVPRPQVLSKKRAPLSKDENDSSSRVLSERSVNMTSPRRGGPSKLSREVRASEASAASAEQSSVVHNTVEQHKVRGTSGAEIKGQTPEWKRRLVYGDVSYGEQRDLFTSAGTGLENIFKPPAAAVAVEQCSRSVEGVSNVRGSPEAEIDSGSETHHDATFPSSPPFHRTVQEEHGKTDETNEASRGMVEPRKASGQSDVRNEEFSAIMLMRRQASDGRASFVVEREQTDKAQSEVAADELRGRLEKLRRNQIVLADGSVQDASSIQAGLDYEQLQGFVNVKRGGRSAEGSFRHRMLSSGLNDTSELLAEESLQASTPKQFPSVRTGSCVGSPRMPPAPRPSPEKREAQTGVSPLKLFQTHDTLTAKTLCTRLSQLESALSNGSRSASGNHLPSSAWPNEFGAGKLDGYEFPEELSCGSSVLADTDKENRGPDDSAQPSRFMATAHSSSPLEDDDLVVHKRRGLNETSSRPSTSDGGKAFGSQEMLATPRRRRDTGPESKRPRTSPSKDPTPKRRRTLHKSDVSYEEGSDRRLAMDMDMVQRSHGQLQSAMTGRKRKDARQGDALGAAAPVVLAARPMLRPRTPTPNQRRPLGEMPVQVAGGPAAAVAVPYTYTDRKPSIKTEDFINEANKIMAMIRSKALLGGSGLASVNESDAVQEEKTTFLDSTREPLSRPPSREGGGVLRTGVVGKRQEDPELVRHLRKYEEAGEEGDLAGLAVRKPSIMDADEISDPPNMRLTTRTVASAESLRDGYASSGPSTGPSTMPTGSSRGSESRRTIAPQSVSHLIGDRVGDMVLDKDKGRWVRGQEDSEGDAFAGIPDLSVDQTLEMQKMETRKKLGPRTEDEVEHEIRLHEDRVGTPRRKHLTISFSSPIASFIQDAPTPRKAKGPSRHVSVGRHTFVARPVSRIEERDEPDGGAGASSLKVSVLADCPVKSSLHAAPTISRHVGTLALSPLADFTVHGPDESLALEASYVVGDHRLATGDGARRVVSMETRDLVDKLGAVEPFEPYWEDMRTLALNGQLLSSVHALDRFCRRLERLDASRNRLRNLSGVPAAVRRLNVSHNELSSLTSWGHLANLQYVDVSNNGLTSLVALGHLVHLRSLRADHNRLTSIDGVKFHDGLQSLRARGNAIEHVDLHGTRLCCLTDLDLRDNLICSATHLDQLTALQSLDLEGNRLTTFALQAPSPVLRHLRLGRNSLHSLDVRNAPRLSLLHADANRLVRVAGLSRTRRIDSLSLREQQGEEPLDVAHLLSRAYEVRKLYLSGNLFPDPQTFDPPVDMLNLQLLDLASCGLAELPDRLGHSLPNLRVLNLNFNALENLAPLAGVPRLKRVLAAGNRITDPAALMAVLANFDHLVTVDLRGNPMTLGFYHPAAPSSSTLVPSSNSTTADMEHHDPFMLPDQDPARDTAYASRLHLHTRMRRRLHETVARAACRRLRLLDGLPLPGAEGRIRSEEEGQVGVRDVVWEALEAKGLLCIQREQDVVDQGAHVEACVA